MTVWRHDSMKVPSIFNHRLPPALSANVICASLVCLAMLFPSASVLAQNTGMQELLNRVDRLQRELSTLQRQVYRGEAPPPAAAMPLSPEAGDPRNAARNSIRIAQLENELQALTGRIEEIGFRTQQIQSRLEKLVSDMDQRLTALEGGTQRGDLPQGVNPPSTVGLALQRPPTGTAPPLSAQGGSPGVTPLPSPPQAAATRGTAPGVLGTIPAEMAVSAPRGPENVPPQPTLRAQAAVPQTAAVEPAAGDTSSVLPAGSPKVQYDYALSLMLQQQDFVKAETALRAFIEQNPDDGLTGNAHYWLGETYYVRKIYQDAAFAFAEGFQKFPKGNKAPESLLKLGMSLDRLEKPREACTAYSRLLSSFPNAGARLKARVEQEQSRAKCR
jgi:tol-pal system protein YbgF